MKIDDRCFVKKIGFLHHHGYLKKRIPIAASFFLEMNFYFYVDSVYSSIFFKLCWSGKKNNRGNPENSLI